MSKKKKTTKPKQVNRSSVRSKQTKSKDVDTSATKTITEELTPKEKRYIKARVEGKTKRDAGLYAGSKTVQGADKLANRLSKKVKIQKAIDIALEAHGATPEFAVGRLKAIAEQDKEIGASRLASKDILELHGWNKSAKPSVQVNLNGFYKDHRQSKQDVIQSE